MNTVTKKVGKGYYDFCPECWEGMRYTRAALKLGTDGLVERLPDKWQRVDAFSVTAIDSTS